MIRTSSEWKNSIYDNHSALLIRAEVELPAGQTLYMDYEEGDDDFWGSGISFEDATSSEKSFDLGNAVMNTFAFKLNNCDGKYSLTVFDEAVITPHIGMELPSGTVEWIQKGKYIITDTGGRGDVLSFTAYDFMLKLETAFSEADITYPTTLGKMAQAICELCGVTLATAAFPNSTYTISEAPSGSNYSCRQMIGYIAQIAGSTARFNPDGELEIKAYEMADMTAGAANYHEITQYAKLETGLSDITITGVKVTSYYNTDSESEKNTDDYTYGDDGYVISVSGNPLIPYGDAETAARLIGAVVIGLTFRPITELKTFFDPSVEAGDAAVITDIKGNTYSFFCTNISASLGSYASIVCGSESASDNLASQYTGSSQVILSILEATSAKFTNLYATKLEAAVGKFGYVKADELEATVAGFGYLTAEEAAFTYATIDNLNAIQAVIHSLDTTYATIESLTAVSASVGELDAAVAVIQSAYITSAQVTTLLADYAKVSQLDAVSATIDSLDATYATIDFANVDIARITTGFVSELLVSQGLIADEVTAAGASITGYLTSVGIVADTITAGTLSVERLVITGEDSIIYEINASSGGLTATELTDEAYRNYINGTVIVANSITAAQIAAGTITSNEIAANTITAYNIVAGAITSTEIAAGAVTAEKISVSDLSALSATIGGFTIGSTSIYSKADAFGTTSSNIYIGTSGISLGTSFMVTYAGALTATSGAIGGWTISDSMMYCSSAVSSGESSTQYQAYMYAPSSAGSSTLAIGTRYRSYDGASTYGSWTNTFYVRYDGYLYAAGGGKIGGWTIGSGQSGAIYNGTTSMTSTTAGTYIGTSGIRQYASSSTYTNIESGVLTAMGAVIMGTITTGSGNYQSVLAGGNLQMYYGSVRYGLFSAVYWTADETQHGIGMHLASEASYMVFARDDDSDGIYTASYIINYGLNPDDYTERHIFYSTARFIGAVTFSNTATFNSNVFHANAYGIYWKNASGTNCRVLQMNSSNQFLVGHSSYDTYVYGSSITVANKTTFSTQVAFLGALTSAYQMTFGNDYGIRGENTSGTAVYMLFMSTADYVTLGHSSYVTNIRGSSIILAAAATFSSTATFSNTATFNSNVFHANAYGIYWKNASGTNYRFLQLNSSNQFLVGNTNYATILYGSTVYLNGTSTTVTSDRRAKKDIGLLPEKYDAMFDALWPVRYRYTDGKSGRYHTGYVAQDVEAALTAAGLDSMDFAGFVDIGGSGTLGLMYDEFIALNTWQIQKLKARVAELETLAASLQGLVARLQQAVA